MSSDQTFCNHPAAASGGRKRAADDADEEEAEKRPKLSDNGSPHPGDQSNPVGTDDGASCCLNEMVNPSAHNQVTSTISDPGHSDPFDPTEVVVLFAENGPLTLSACIDPSDTTGPWRTTGLEHILSSEHSSSCTNQTAEDPHRRSGSGSSNSSSCSIRTTNGSPSPSSCCCCSREGDSPSKLLIPNGSNGPDGPTSLQSSRTENVVSEASSRSPLSRAEVEEEIQVPECLWQQDASDPDLVESNAAGGECSCSNDDDNGGSKKAICDSDEQMVRGSSGSPILLAKSSMWKSFINPSDPSGLKLILQRIPDPLDCLHNDGKKGEVEAGCNCEGAAGTDSDKVIKLCQLFPGDSECRTALPNENELEDIASSDPCSCSWCCNSCSSISSHTNSSGGGSIVESRERPTAKVDEKNAEGQPEIPDKMEKSPRLQGGLKMEEEGDEPEEEDTASCSSCLSIFAQDTHEIDRGVALCASDASSSSWTDEAPDGYSKLVPSLRYS